MHSRKTLMLALLPAGLLAAQSSHAFDVVPAGEPVVTGEPSRVGAPWNHRSTFNIPGTNTDVAFGGYVKFDALYDFDYDQGLVTSPLSLTDEENRTEGRTTFTAAESRLNFRTQTRFGDEVLRTYVEGHFIPDEKFNLRHAYGEFNGFLAGKTWTNFMHFLGAPRTLKLGAPIGYTFERQPQVRYTHQAGPNTFAVALEDSDTSITPIRFTPTGPDVQSETPYPDLTLRYQYKRNFAIAGIVRELATDETEIGFDDSTMGYGLSAQVALPLGERLTLKGNTMLGTGLGNYLGVTPDFVEAGRAPDAFVDGDQLESVDFQSFGASLDIRWNGAWSSAIGSTVVEQDLPDSFTGYADTVQFSYTNLIWDVNDRLFTGVELQYSDVELVSGEERDNTRIQASVQYHF